jgi:hypothetical protein
VFLPRFTARVRQGSAEARLDRLGGLIGKGGWFVSKLVFAAVMGAAPVGLCLCSSVAFAQTTTPLPTVDVHARAQPRAARPAKKARRKSEGSAEGGGDGGGAGGGGGSGGDWGTGSGERRVDLAPDSPANAYRVAPSSRQHADVDKLPAQSEVVLRSNRYDPGDIQHADVMESVQHDAVDPGKLI